jgi:hypothetical protein
MKFIVQLLPALRGVIIYSFLQFPAAEAAEAKIRQLNELRAPTQADIWLWNGLVFRNYTVTGITKTTITLKSEDETKDFSIFDIYHIRRETEIFTQENASYFEILGLEKAWDYLERYGDYIIDNDYQTLRGKIIAVKPAEIEIRLDQETKSVRLENVLQYRKQREVITLHEQPITLSWMSSLPKGTTGSPVIGRLFGFQNHLTELTLATASPINIFPQLNAGIQTNSNWPVFFGARAGLSGPLITAGWFYGQAQLFAGIRLPNIAFVETSLRVGYLFRESAVLYQVQCNCQPGTTDKDLSFGSAAISQKNYYIAAAFTFRAVFVEIGWEIKDYLSISVEGPKITNPMISANSRESISDSMAQMNKTANLLAEFSRFYFTAGIKLAFL